MKEPVSSTQYRFSYQIRSARDLPADFDLQNENLSFEFGIFLPQDQFPDVHKGSSHPARVFLLENHGLTIYTHPSSHQAVARIDLAGLQMVEQGRFLLRCWVSFFTAQIDRTFFFSSESSRTVSGLLKQIRCRWLPHNAPGKVSLGRSREIEDGIAFKFQKRLEKEIDTDETIEEMMFIPPQKIYQRKHLLRKVIYVPGDLLAITSQRVLWITDREQGGTRIAWEYRTLRTDYCSG